MKFLVDNSVSPAIAHGLKKAGHDAVHLRDFQMQSATDDVVFDFAHNENRILISADTDFGFILAVRKSKNPSLILFRHDSERRPEKQLTLLLNNLPALGQVLEKGSIVVFGSSRLRIRSLPIA